LIADGKHPVWHRFTCESSACIEVARLDTEILIRDSEDPDGPLLRFSQREWEAFVAGIRTSDLPLD
jgi:hypothetical protein